MSRERERRDGGRGDERSLSSVDEIDRGPKKAVSLETVHSTTARLARATPPPVLHPSALTPSERRHGDCRDARVGAARDDAVAEGADPDAARADDADDPRPRPARGGSGRRGGGAGAVAVVALPPNPARRFRTSDARGASRVRRGRRRASLHPPSSAERPPYFPPRTAVFFDAPGPQRLPSQALEQLPQSFVCIDDLQQAGISATDIKARVATRVILPPARPPTAGADPPPLVHPRRKSRRRATAPSSPS